MQATSKAMSRYIQMNQMNVELQKMRDKLRAEMLSTRLRDLEIMIKRAQELDLAFLVDVTGSMQKYIDVVKEKISDIAAGVMKAYPQLKLRVAFAPYKDYGESMDDADACDFTESFSGRGSIFVEILARVRAGNGDDAPRVPLLLRWRFACNIIKIIGIGQCPQANGGEEVQDTSWECTKNLQAVEAYLEQMEVQTVAARLAMAFNQELQNLRAVSYKTVQFTLVSVLKVGSNYFNMEKVLKGQWIRFSNNANYVNTKGYAATLHAFTHWTHERSKGLLMVTDLQGVQMGSSTTSKEFWLCDPAVHCTYVLRYQKTRTNWGEHGFNLFFDTHKCNNICRGLRLKPTKNGFTTEGTQLK